MSFTQGISGLNAASSRLDSIGHNISNSQTVGFKSGRTEFADIYAGAKTGLGVTTTGLTQSFAGGALTNTSRNLDMAIDGGGFFRMQDGGQTTFSRNGQFNMTRDGFLANGDGARLTGYNVTNFNGGAGEPRIDAAGAPEPINIPSERMNAMATTRASLEASLDAGTDVNNAAFNPEDAESYDWSTPTAVFDSLGNAHSTNMYFTKTGENTWRVNASMALGSESNLAQTVSADAEYEGFDPVANGNGQYEFSINGNDYVARVSGSVTNEDGTHSGGQINYEQRLPEVELSFSANGNLTNAAQADKPANLRNSAVAYQLNAQNGSAPIDYTFDFTGSSQTAQSFSASAPTQNGYRSGDLTGVAVQKDGTIRGSYSNGQSVDLAQVALANFRNEQGLEPVGGNAWVQTADSGEPALGVAGTGQFGDLLGSTLEESNVDLSGELVSMIVAQRNYQANSQTIKTQDQILQTAVSLR